MTFLTPKQAAHVLRVLLQHAKKELDANPQFTLSNLVTLLAVIETPGATQPEIAQLSESGDPGVLSRQLRYLRGKRQGVVQSPLRPVVTLSPLETDNRLNVVDLTEEGEQFAAELARTFNRLLKPVLKQT
jgi:DNA-binding MarR family transcriptional regulator